MRRAWDTKQLKEKGRLSSIITIQVFSKTWLNRKNNELSHTIFGTKHACWFLSHWTAATVEILSIADSQFIAFLLRSLRINGTHRENLGRWNVAPPYDRTCVHLFIVFCFILRPLKSHSFSLGIICRPIFTTALKMQRTLNRSIHGASLRERLHFVKMFEMKKDALVHIIHTEQ